MDCDQCGARMLKVGRQIKPGHPEVWIDGYVCPTRKCYGHATIEYDGSTTRWPSLTLTDVYIHACIRGAMRFRDGGEP